ncbi:MAG TPA: endonuclease III [Thermodesulfovibrio thiophilus]|uniref:endonuclease III n=1 Tax=Thermodesulfovibrio thiophilus TaxID=340095 RepID=UPI0017D75682|nr:endonuclease III [Thermodesulfovibrio thiophilus]HHW20057.1 endonuclease III [Thermodesulfovibrio thiophilus]HOA83886.1 endonuclease III [Thermodesulfovibrio thiophilus]HQA04596.1 endonuclease III [Thermodesulfovibrio thiophilus]HQD36024.1 endonuclease III [Thermodesulfovibrio thiophilus]
MNKKEKVLEIIRRLEKRYPDVKTALNFKTALDLLVATILSAQTTDVNVNKVTEKLFKKYKTVYDYANVPLEELQEDIKSINFYKNKANYIKNLAKVLIDRFNGELPKSMEELVSLSGVGRKTANIVLWNAFGINEGIAVDTHVKRISKLLGLTENTDPEKIEQDLMEITPHELWGKLSHLLIMLGREICKAKAPNHKECPLNDLCPSSRI